MDSDEEAIVDFLKDHGELYKTNEHFKDKARKECTRLMNILRTKQESHKHKRKGGRGTETQGGSPEGGNCTLSTGGNGRKACKDRQK